VTTHKNIIQSTNNKKDDMYHCENVKYGYDELIKEQTLRSRVSDI